MLALDPAGKRLAIPNLRSSTVNKLLHSAVGYVELDDRGMPRKNGEKLAMTVQDLTEYGEIPAAMGCVFVSDTVAIFGAGYGPLTWDPENRRGNFGQVYLPDLRLGQMRLVGHPTLPAVYLTGMGTAIAVSMEHADGYLTMLPQRLTIAGAVLASPPVLMAKRNEMALGGASKIYVAKLDGGRFAAPVTYTAVNSPAVEALAYSEKFDRLYVAVEKVP